jgi:hypothetical protein
MRCDQTTFIVQKARVTMSAAEHVLRLWFQTNGLRECVAIYSFFFPRPVIVINRDDNHDR